ncbi:MAG: glucose 1-dehydrogenase [Pseudomonadota bacterium]
MNRVDNKIVLITGAARGLGAATALKLSQAGAKTVLTDLLDEAGEQVVSKIHAEGGEALYLHHDVTDEGAWEQVIQQACEHFGGLDVLVNNAGIGESAPIEEFPLETWRRIMSVNLDGVFLGLKHAIPMIKQRAAQWPGGGSIINISSILGLVGMAPSAAYVASKGAVRLLTKAVAMECAANEYNIRVNSVHPGFTDTQMIHTAFTDLVEMGAMETEEAAQEQIRMLHPIGRLGEPIDIANGVLFLASDDSAFMTGSELVIDGGYTAQ